MEELFSELSPKEEHVFVTFSIDRCSKQLYYRIASEFDVILLLLDNHLGKSHMPCLEML